MKLQSYLDDCLLLESFSKLLKELLEQLRTLSEDPRKKSLVRHSVLAKRCKANPKWDAPKRSRMMHSMATAESNSSSNSKFSFKTIIEGVHSVLSELFRTCFVPIEKMQLYSVIFYTSEETLEEAFLPRPRTVIKQALERPSQYLHCTCINVENCLDVALLFKLYAEFGRFINLFDWCQAFGIYRSQIDKEELQARFTLAVQELHILGLIHLTKRKTDHVVKTIALF